jgi:hypothetical protein
MEAQPFIILLNFLIALMEVGNLENKFMISERNKLFHLYGFLP